VVNKDSTILRAILARSICNWSKLRIGGETNIWPQTNCNKNKTCWDQLCMSPITTY